MEGVNWKYNDSQTKIFWGVSCDYYLYLGQLFIEFDFKFNQSLGERTLVFELTKEQVEFIICGVEERLDSLIEKFDLAIPIGGLTTVSNFYKGEEYRFYVKMSRNHRLINGLVRFYNFLIKSNLEDKKIIFWGGNIE
jgi:hypothetical protein